MPLALLSAIGKIYSHKRISDTRSYKLSSDPLKIRTAAGLLYELLCVQEKLMSQPKDRVVVASDVNSRDGIGVEIYRDDELVVEIFRDDTDRTRTVTVFKESVSLELMEECIAIFKKEIPLDFIKYEE